MNPLQFRTATTEDASAIAQLVNQAYRPEPGARGWTHEAELVAGTRTHAGQVQALIAKKDSVILLGLHGPDIVACVHIEKDGSETHFGMLAVRPNLQGAGAGKDMLAYAEDYATRHFRAERFVMVVVSSRKELLSFYLRRGYQQTGAVKAYPLDAEAGVPKREDLEIEVLHKASNLNPDCPLECSCM